MPGGDEDVRINESADVCIVISALQIIERRLSIVYITTIGQGVGDTEGCDGVALTIPAPQGGGQRDEVAS